VNESGPLVSIVTPAYRAGPFVGQCIASVQAQTFPEWEMLVVDDCSPDDTCAVVEGFAAKDPRVRLLRQPRNGGPALARDAAVLAARGRYVAFLDSDDWWLPGKLERQIEYMRRTGAAVTFTGFRRVNREGLEPGGFVDVPGRLTHAQLLKNTAMATSTVVVDRQATGPFRMTQTYYDDYALWLDLLKRGFTAHGLREDLMRYRVVGQSVSRNKARSALWVWRTYRQVAGLSVPRAAWCFLHYALRAAWKYRRF
jgi:teichuronic acid biosynthesis glycosyltransferase TuaG